MRFRQAEKFRESVRAFNMGRDLCYAVLRTSGVFDVVSSVIYN